MIGDEKVIYLGNSISKEGFRVYVYGQEGRKKLVNSYDEFKDCMESGDWFACIADVTNKKTSKKPEK